MAYVPTCVTWNVQRCSKFRGREQRRTFRQDVQPGAPVAAAGSAA